MKSKFALALLLVGLLSACGSQPATEAPASAPTEAPVSATEALAQPTAVPAATDTVAPTDAVESSPTPETVPAGATVSFANDILPIFESRCLNCHGGEKTQEGLSVKTYADLMSGSENGPVVAAGDAENSLMAELVVSQKMPKRGPKLTPPQVQLIIDWINQGALNN